MKKTIYPTTLFLVLFLFQSAHLNLEWGFFGHRLINRMAVFTLPPGMMIFYKKNIEYVSDHAVDPDKRRYATKHEAVRHYIDLDIWGEYPFENFPRTQIGALMKYTDVFVIDKQNDTIDNLMTSMQSNMMKSSLSGQLAKMKESDTNINSPSLMSINKDTNLLDVLAKEFQQKGLN